MFLSGIKLSHGAPISIKLLHGAPISIKLLHGAPISIKLSHGAPKEIKFCRPLASECGYILVPVTIITTTKKLWFIQSGQKDMLVFNTFFFCKPSYLAEPLALPGTALQILLLLGEKVNDSASKFVYTT